MKKIMYDVQQKKLSLEETLKKKLNCYIFLTLGQNKLRMNLMKLKSGELDSCGVNKASFTSVLKWPLNLRTLR